MAYRLCPIDLRTGDFFLESNTGLVFEVLAEASEKKLALVEAMEDALIVLRGPRGLSEQRLATGSRLYLPNDVQVELVSPRRRVQPDAKVEETSVRDAKLSCGVSGADIGDAGDSGEDLPVHTSGARSAATPGRHRELHRSHLGNGERWPGIPSAD